MENNIKKMTPKQAEYSAAQIICPPPNGGNNSPEVQKMMEKEKGDKKMKRSKYLRKIIYVFSLCRWAAFRKARM